MERILIVEQDAQRMEEIRSALDGEYKLTSCSTQEEAIAVLQHKIPDYKTSVFFSSGFSTAPLPALPICLFPLFFSQTEQNLSQVYSSLPHCILSRIFVQIPFHPILNIDNRPAFSPSAAIPFLTVYSMCYRKRTYAFFLISNSRLLY